MFSWLRSHVQTVHEGRGNDSYPARMVMSDTLDPSLSSTTTALRIPPTFDWPSPDFEFSADIKRFWPFVDSPHVIWRKFQIADGPRLWFDIWASFRAPHVCPQEVVRLRSSPMVSRLTRSIVEGRSLGVLWFPRQEGVPSAVPLLVLRCMFLGRGNPDQPVCRQRRCKKYGSHCSH